MLPYEHLGRATEKSSVDEIRARFDSDVDRFSNIQVGQQATIDSTLAMNLIARAASAVTPDAKHLLEWAVVLGTTLLSFLSGFPAFTLLCSI